MTQLQTMVLMSLSVRFRHTSLSLDSKL
jgi:hypothetical protein